jgi:hypothetical protein
MCKKLLFLVLLLGFVNTASATWVGWDNGGGDRLWITPENWNPDGVPLSTDSVNFQNIPEGTGPIVDWTCMAEIEHTFITDGTTLTVTGGSLRAGMGSYIMLGSNQGDKKLATLEQTGGTVETLMMCIGNEGPGLLKAYGGTLITNNLEMRYGTMEGLVDITEGTIIDYDNVESDLDKINAYIESGKIIANGGNPGWFVHVEHDPLNDRNIITAIPEPATIMLLGLGGLTLIRRKR